MSFGLTLYAIQNKRLNIDEIISPIIIQLDDNTGLIEYFIEGDGVQDTFPLPMGKKIFQYNCDDEMPNLIETNGYGERLKCCVSSAFYNIPKDILKKEPILNRAAIKFIKKLVNYTIILEFT